MYWPGDGVLVVGEAVVSTGDDGVQPGTVPARGSTGQGQYRLGVVPARDPRVDTAAFPTAVTA